MLTRESEKEGTSRKEEKRVYYGDARVFPWEWWESRAHAPSWLVLPSLSRGCQRQRRPLTPRGPNSPPLPTLSSTRSFPSWIVVSIYHLALSNFHSSWRAHSLSHPLPSYSTSLMALPQPSVTLDAKKPTPSVLAAIPSTIPTSEDFSQVHHRQKENIYLSEK